MKITYKMALNGIKLMAEGHVYIALRIYEYDNYTELKVRGIDEHWEETYKYMYSVTAMGELRKSIYECEYEVRELEENEWDEISLNC